jgi:hypothetical protein
MNVGRKKLTLANIMNIILTHVKTMKILYFLLVMLLKIFVVIFGL